MAAKKKSKKTRLGGLTKKVSIADIRKLRADGDGDSPKKTDGDSPKKGRAKARRLHDDGDSPKKARGKVRGMSDGDGDSPKKTLPTKKRGRLLGE